MTDLEAVRSSAKKANNGKKDGDRCRQPQLWMNGIMLRL